MEIITPRRLKFLGENIQAGRYISHFNETKPIKVVDKFIMNDGNEILFDNFILGQLNSSLFVRLTDGTFDSWAIHIDQIDSLISELVKVRNKYK